MAPSSLVRWTSTAPSLAEAARQVCRSRSESLVRKPEHETPPGRRAGSPQPRPGQSLRRAVARRSPRRPGGAVPNRQHVRATRARRKIFGDGCRKLRGARAPAAADQHAAQRARCRRVHIARLRAGSLIGGSARSSSRSTPRKTRKRAPRGDKAPPWHPAEVSGRATTGKGSRPRTTHPAGPILRVGACRRAATEGTCKLQASRQGRDDGARLARAVKVGECRRSLESLVAPP